MRRPDRQNGTETEVEMMKRSIVVLVISMFAFALIMSVGSGPLKAQDKVNINTATAEQLQELPGIGKKVAERIIEYREKNQFEKPEDLMQVKGIGAKKYEKIKDLITVE
jgi:competence protein ComEA